MERFDINEFFDACRKMDKHERKLFIETLRRHGLDIADISCYTYPDAPGIRHVFFYFDGGSPPVPYFMLEKDLLAKVQEFLKKWQAGAFCE